MTLACALTFLVVKGIEYHAKFVHFTLVATEKTGASKPTSTTGTGTTATTANASSRDTAPRVPADKSLDINLVSEKTVRLESKQEEPKEFDLTADTVGPEVNYGPWRNIFFSCYYTLTGVHGIHVLAGVIALSVLLIQSAPEETSRPTRSTPGCIGTLSTWSGSSCSRCFT